MEPITISSNPIPILLDGSMINAMKLPAAKPVVGCNLKPRLKGTQPTAARKSKAKGKAPSLVA